MSLPNPDMDAVPFTPITSQWGDEIIENIEALADGTGLDDGAIAANKTNLAPGQQAWQTPTMQNGWIVFSVNYPPAQYMKDSLGFVHIRGVIKSGSSGSTIFTLPVGYRPSLSMYIGVGSNGATGILEILPTGVVKHATGATSSFSIDNVSFRAEG